nr:hypothetical protein - Chlorobium limicola f.sp. thiosulfatophilum [Chlorobaculum thiosulfatiphilum]
MDHRYAGIRSNQRFQVHQRQSADAIALDRVHSQGYSFQIEIDFRVWKKGLVIHEVPIIFVDRSVGKSKMTRKNIVEAVWMVWWLKLLSIAGSCSGGASLGGKKELGRVAIQQKSVNALIVTRHRVFYPGGCIFRFLSLMNTPIFEFSMSVLQ